MPVSPAFLWRSPCGKQRSPYRCPRSGREDEKARRCCDDRAFCMLPVRNISPGFDRNTHSGKRMERGLVRLLRLWTGVLPSGKRVASSAWTRGLPPDVTGKSGAGFPDPDQRKNIGTAVSSSWQFAAIRRPVRRGRRFRQESACRSWQSERNRL